MAQTYLDFTGNGITREYLFTIPYILPEHVFVSVDGVDVPFTWTTSQWLLLDDVPADGTAIRIYRNSNSTHALHEFPDPSYLRNTNLDGNNTHLRYLIQELQSCATHCTEAEISALQAAASAVDAATAADTAADSAVDAAAAASAAEDAAVVAEDLAGFTWTFITSTSTDLPLGGGAPSLTTLSGDTVAYMDGSLKKLRTYKYDGNVFALIGTEKSISTAAVVAISALTSTTIALVDSGFDRLWAYTWNGSTWSSVGNFLTISGLNISDMAALNSTDIALIEANANYELQTYTFDGSDWTLKGSPLPLTTLAPKITKLNSTDIAMVDNTLNEIQVYRFDGTNWTTVGNPYVIANLDTPSIMAISATDVVVTDTYYDTMSMFRFDGTDWTPVGNVLDYPTMGSAGMTALNGTDFAFIESNGDDLRVYNIGYYLGAPPP